MLNPVRQNGHTLINPKYIYAKHSTHSVSLLKNRHNDKLQITIWKKKMNRNLQRHRQVYFMEIRQCHLTSQFIAYNHTLSNCVRHSHVSILFVLSLFAFFISFLFIFVFFSPKTKRTALAYISNPGDTRHQSIWQKRPVNAWRNPKILEYSANYLGKCLILQQFLLTCSHKKK